jgi:hypothetical protein
MRVHIYPRLAGSQELHESNDIVRVVFPDKGLGELLSYRFQV